MNLKHAGTRTFLLLFFVTLVIGIWHALPNTLVVGDESLYVGNVLRAMQLHSLTPHISNTYTLSFYASYLVMSIPVGIAFLYFHFNVASITAFLYTHYDLLYLVPRFVSVIASLAIAYTLLRMATTLGHSRRTSFGVVALILSTIIVTVIMHTGKMWALSGMFLVLSDYFFLRVLTVENTHTTPWYNSSLFWCIGCGFLGSANFPFVVIALLSVPYFMYHFRSERPVQKRIVLYSLFWFVVFTVLVLVNLDGWLGQNGATQLSGTEPSFIENLWYQILLIAYLLPLLAIGVAVHIRQIIHRPLLLLAAAQCALFILLLCVRAPWAAGQVTMLRYSFFVALLFGIMLLSTSLARKKTLTILLLISFVFFIKTLYLLAVPTTYNQAHDWVVATLAPKKVFVANTIGELDVPKNRASYELLASQFCSSRCIVEKQYRLNEPFTYLVEDSLASSTAALPRTYANIPHYRLTTTQSTSSIDHVITSFGENRTDTDYFAVAHSIGLYSLDFLSVPRLGPNIYVYEVRKDTKI